MIFTVSFEFNYRIFLLDERPFVPPHVSTISRQETTNHYDSVTEDNILGRIARFDGRHSVSTTEQTQPQSNLDVKGKKLYS